MVALIVRLALLCLLPLVLMLLVEAMPGLAPLWDFANAAGLFAAVLLLLLFVYSGRPLSSPHYDGKFFLGLHRDLGYVTLLLLAAHIGLLAFEEPLVLDYLLPSAAAPMLAGTLATLLLLVLIPISLAPLRQRLWRHHLRFKRWHYGIGAALLVLLAIHVIGVGYYSGTRWKALLWGGLTGAALAWPLLPRRALERGNERRRRNTAVFASWLSAGLLLFALALAGLFALLANSDLPL
ncbi:hypothetical protein D3C84_754560 [compost metagenome]